MALSARKSNPFEILHRTHHVQTFNVQLLFFSTVTNWLPFSYANSRYAVIICCVFCVLCSVFSSVCGVLGPHMFGTHVHGVTDVCSTGAEMVSRYCQDAGDWEGAIEFLLMAKRTTDAFSLAKSHAQMDVFTKVPVFGVGCWMLGVGCCSCRLLFVDVFVVAVEFVCMLACRLNICWYADSPEAIDIVSVVNQGIKEPRNLEQTSNFRTAMGFLLAFLSISAHTHRRDARLSCWGVSA